MRIKDTDILMINMDGKVINKFKNYSEATREVGLKGSSLISKICKNGYGSCAGHYWLNGAEYKKKVSKNTLNDWLKNNVRISKPIDRASTPVVQLNKNTYELLNRYSTLNEAAEANGLDNKNGYDSIVKCCKFSRKSAKGFIWLLEEDYDNLTIDEIKQRHNEINNLNPNNKKISKYTMPIVKLEKNSFDFVERYDSIIDAVESNDMNDKGSIDGIIRCCRFGRKSTNGYVWLLEEDFNSLSKEEISNLFKDSNKNYMSDRRTFNNTPIVQLNAGEYTFIKRFDSINAASEALNITASGISKCCKFQRRTSGGYAWMYLSDFTTYSLDEIKSLYGQIFWN